MGKKTPPSTKHPAWTTARYWQFIRSALRKAWTRYPPRFETLNRSKRTVTGKRHKFEYRCAECKKWYKQKDVQVDHIVSAGKLTEYDDLPEFVEKLFCSTDELCVLCKTCHQEKTNEERRSKK